MFTCSFRMFTLRKVRCMLSCEERLLLYKSFILPSFDQGSLFYNSSTKEHLNSMQSLQNKCLRLVYNSSNWPGTWVAHLQSKLLNTTGRRHLILLKYAHIKSFNRRNLKDHTTRTLRSNRKLLLRESKSNNTKYEKSYVSLSTKLWNSLPGTYKHLNVKAFKTRVTHEMLQGKINFPE